MSQWMVYLILKLDAIRDFLSILAGSSLGIFLMFACGYFIASDTRDEKIKVLYEKKSIKFLILGVIICILLIFIELPIPSTKEYIIIRLAPEIITQAKQIDLSKLESTSGKALDLINLKLDNAILELKGEKTENKSERK